MPTLYRSTFMAEAQRGHYRTPKAPPEPKPDRRRVLSGSRKPWMPADSRLLAQLLRDRTPMYKIAALMGRAETTLRRQAEKMAEQLGLVSK